MNMEQIMNFFASIDWAQVIVFFCCSLVNVMLSTVKSILTVRSTKNVAAVINAITYGFYAIVVKQLAELSVPVTVIVTIITNLIGVYISMWILDKLKRDNLWKITVTTASENLEKIANQLKVHDIGCTYIPITPKKGVIDIYSNTQKESAIIRDILKQYDVKYCITEVKKTL